MTALHRIQDFVKDQYTREDLIRLDRFLEQHRTLLIEPLANGLFPASGNLSPASHQGYHDFWIRDNVMIASSFLLRGDLGTTISTMRGLTAVLWKQQERFRRIIQDPSHKTDVQERPHVRFNTSGESGKWSHAQNDALGYALWLRFVLANAGQLDLDNREFELYRLFPLYFEAIEYWADRDSGAWEEDRKVNSSSIGAVVAGLRAMQIWLEAAGIFNADVLLKRVKALIRQGIDRLQQFRRSCFSSIRQRFRGPHKKTRS